MKTDSRLHDIVAAQPYPLLFATISEGISTGRHSGRRAVPKMFHARHQANFAQETEAPLLLRV
jgi:hypothetical protein